MKALRLISVGVQVPVCERLQPQNSSESCAYSSPSQSSPTWFLRSSSLNFLVR